MDRKALSQLLVTILLVAAGALGFSAYRSRPQDAGQLEVSVAELRSTASECALLSVRAPTQASTRAYRQVHLEMMRSSAGDALKALESARVQPGLESLRDSSVLMGRALLEELTAWGSAERSDPRRFQQLSARLQAFENRLE